MKKISGQKGSFIALLPLLFFVLTFLGAGIYLNDFYALPSPIAVIVGIALAFIIFREPVAAKVKTFLRGCGDDKIMTMCVIYLLAGAFAVVTKATGSVSAVVDLGMQVISIEFLYAGIFVLAAFLSFASGTSVGAIVALAAIVVGFAEESGASLPILSASLLGGAMFGDNLSFISDTTIAATQSLEVEMKDKFRQNFKIALPAAILTVVILIYQGSSLPAASITSEASIELIKILPYLLVIILAILGLNVFVVLFTGIIVAGAIGLYHADFSLLEFAKLSYEGFTGMTEIFLLSMLTGGLAAMVTKAGGLTYISTLLTGKLKKQTGYFGIGSLVGLTNFAVANNTVSIIVTGSIAKEIKDRLKLQKEKVASVLDIFACIIQGILPYGAQVLLLLSYAGGSMGYLELVFNAWYIWLLLGSTIIYFSLHTKKLSTARVEQIYPERKEAV